MKTIRLILSVTMALLLAGMCFASVSALGAVTHTETATTPIDYGDLYHINLYLHSAAGDGWWNGTLYVNLTNPYGSNVVVDHVHLTINNTGYNNNFTYDRAASIAGTWTVSWDFALTTKSVTPLFPAIADHTDSFVVGTITQNVANDMNGITVLLFTFGAILMLFLVMMTFVHLFDKKGKR